MKDSIAACLSNRLGNHWTSCNLGVSVPSAKSPGCTLLSAVLTPNTARSQSDKLFNFCPCKHGPGYDTLNTAIHGPKSLGGPDIRLIHRILPLPPAGFSFEAIRTTKAWAAIAQFGSTLSVIPIVRHGWHRYTSVSELFAPGTSSRLLGRDVNNGCRVRSVGLLLFAPQTGSLFLQAHPRAPGLSIIRSGIGPPQRARSGDFYRCPGSRLRPGFGEAPVDGTTVCTP
jgi:hypothetical protein